MVIPWRLSPIVWDLSPHFLQNVATVRTNARRSASSAFAWLFRVSNVPSKSLIRWLSCSIVIITNRGSRCLSFTGVASHVMCLKNVIEIPEIQNLLCSHKAACSLDVAIATILTAECRSVKVTILRNTNRDLVLVFNLICDANKHVMCMSKQMILNTSVWTFINAKHACFEAVDYGLTHGFEEFCFVSSTFLLKRMSNSKAFKGIEVIHKAFSLMNVLLWDVSSLVISFTKGIEIQTVSESSRKRCISTTSVHDVSSANEADMCRLVLIFEEVPPDEQTCSHSIDTKSRDFSKNWIGHQTIDGILVVITPDKFRRILKHPIFR